MNLHWAVHQRRHYGTLNKGVTGLPLRPPRRKERGIEKEKTEKQHFVLVRRAEDRGIIHTLAGQSSLEPLLSNHFQDCYTLLALVVGPNRAQDRCMWSSRTTAQKLPRALRRSAMRVPTIIWMSVRKLDEQMKSHCTGCHYNLLLRSPQYKP